MSWSDVYLSCFLVGTTLSVLSFLAGVVHVNLPFKVHMHLHLPHVHMHHGAAHSGGTHIPWFNATTMLAFLAWFGGVGYLMTKYSHVETLLIAGVATAAGMAAGWVMLRFLAKLVGPSEPLREWDRQVLGALGTVSMTIREDGTGEIIFPLGGSRRCSGARSSDGAAIAKGTEVVIERYEKGIAYVKKWDELVK
jgi:hypothetical protein